MTNFLADGLLAANAWVGLVVFLILTHVTIVSVTIFLHRAQAHRALELHPLLSHFFRFWLWLTTGMVTKEWVAVHRKHHAKCETVDDPHSPQIFGLKALLLRGVELYRAEAARAQTLERYGHGTPNDWLERNVYAKHSSAGLALMLVVDVALFGAIGITVWAVQMVWIPFLATGVINGVGHYSGYRNFETPDASANVIPCGILIGGEEMHNNHHAYPTSAKFSVRWYEIDISWGYIRMFEALGLVKAKTVAARPRFVAPRQVIDVEALQAVLRHKYHVISEYTRMLRRVWKEEENRLSQISKTHKFELRGVRERLHLLRLDEAQRAKLQRALRLSDALRKLLEMREELTALWDSSLHSGEHLATRLESWCRHAERSGIRALCDFSQRLRSYAPA